MDKVFYRSVYSKVIIFYLVMDKFFSKLYRQVLIFYLVLDKVFSKSVYC